MSFKSFDGGSTTRPNSPQYQGVPDQRLHTTRDFAKLVPKSRAAHLAFHRVVLAFEKEPVKYEWHRRFIHVHDAQSILEPDTDGHSSGDSASSRESSPTLPMQIYTGFYRLNLNIRPLSRQYGWVLGCGRWAKKFVEHGGVDLILDPNHNPAVGGRHCRVNHILDSNALLIIANKRVRVGGTTLDPAQIQISSRALGEMVTEIELGDLQYSLEFTDIDQDIYRAQLQTLRASLDYEGFKPPETIDPTPSETDYIIMGKYIVRTSFAKGAFGFVCAAIDQRDGTPVAVKKIIATTSRSHGKVIQEVKTLRKLMQNSRPSSILQLVDYFSIDSKDDQGVHECFFICKPLFSKSLYAFIPPSTASMSTRLVLFTQMLQGLIWLHDRGCMHRDIKPQNILASIDPIQAVIIDFGCATWQETSYEHWVGTYAYLAPEVVDLKNADNARDPNLPLGNVYDKSADVWSMGISALELLSTQKHTWTMMSEDIYNQVVRRMLASCRDEEAMWAFEIISGMLEMDSKKRIDKRVLEGRLAAQLYGTEASNKRQHT
ncbi:Protein kinase-like (PK-like) [Glarea lozoyensis ATCC 20868]|uniref:Protein kinase-like (PK-like) n=1 Tax=Glarea lozoyensis (strain ATCC 20868 / MF5171) TaxID=1116229 RepID=S3CYA9_GLAL2|nr:Protein kinase-like (PK-like) [Glarea lozoyensis ATCC 20868]EPE30600.1 Protein kinase-like (PK-like) [Glarea lozoyensis ATCC 20868]